MSAQVAPNVEPVCVAQYDTANGRIQRFDLVERLLHSIGGILVLLLIGTGAVMYIGILAGLFGARQGVETVHLWSGLALPVVFLLSVIGPWGKGLRRDMVRLGRFREGELAWLKRRNRSKVRVGKFNPGQKINSILVAGALPVMLVTGAMLEWNASFSDTIRTGATFTHDWGYLLFTLLVLGHIRMALRNPVTIKAIVVGDVPDEWAREHHPRWHAEVHGVPDHVVPPTMTAGSTKP